MLPTQIAPGPGAAVQPVLPDAAKQQIVYCMLRHHPPERIAALVEQNFHIKVDREQMLACWYARNTRPTPTEPDLPEPNLTARREDKESVQLPADQVGAPLFTRMPGAETPDAGHPCATVSAASSTRTGPGQEKDSMPISREPVEDPTIPRMAPADPPSTDAAPAILPKNRVVFIVDAEQADLQTESAEAAPPTQAEPEPGPEKDTTQILPDAVRAYIVEHMARHEPPWWIAKEVERIFALVLDRDEILVCWRDRDALPTRTGPGQKKASAQKLTDEIREFIVKRLACYETPSRIAAAVRINFGIDIDRRRIFDYNPAGSRPPARRWIDLHAATRARFLRDVAEIGVAQKTVRLRALDRFAQLAEDDSRYDKAAKYLEQAARECGGFYERRLRIPASRSHDEGA